VSAGFVTQSVVARFWAKVDITPGCWEWTAFRKNNYGRIILPTGRKRGQVVYAHRLSWELRNGPIPDGLFVCHKCDNPPCVNPDHLFLGSNDDNMADMHAKGRGVQPCGAEHGRALFTDEQVREIRARRASGEIARTIAQDFACSVATIRDLAKRRTWRHVS
jgi:hypothetical protein